MRHVYVKVKLVTLVIHRTYFVPVTHLLHNKPISQVIEPLHDDAEAGRQGTNRSGRTAEGRRNAPAGVRPFAPSQSLKST